MKSRPALVFLFLLFGLIIYLLFDGAVTIGVRNSQLTQFGKVNKILNHDSFPQLAIFGSSVGEVDVKSSVLQRQTGLSAYNYSIEATRFMQYAGLIDELGEASKTTRFVIMTETYFSLLKADALAKPERFVTYISNENVYRSLHGIQPDLAWKCRYIPGYKYTIVSRLFYKAAFNGWARYVRKQAPDTMLGYTPPLYCAQGQDLKAFKSLEPFSMEIDSLSLKRYIECVNRLQKKGIRVMIVLAPFLMPMVQTMTDFDPLRKAFAHISNETKCVFWDFSNRDAIGRNQYLFCSTFHLNSNGADIFTQMLSDSICSYVNCSAGKPE